MNTALQRHVSRLRILLLAAATVLAAAAFAAFYPAPQDDPGRRAEARDFLKQGVQAFARRVRSCHRAFNTSQDG
jgi:hypothetical protein